MFISIVVDHQIYDTISTSISLPAIGGNGRQVVTFNVDVPFIAKVIESVVDFASLLQEVAQSPTDTR
jgi:hypothetical protein